MLQELEQIQIRLASKIRTEGSGLYLPNEPDLILALDIQYQQEQAFIGGALGTLGGANTAVWVGEGQVSFPYYPGYFCFREGPVLYDFVRYLVDSRGQKPQLIIIDGQGLAHPREFGVACWLGLALRIPCLGLAKKSLIPYDSNLALDKGNYSYVFQNGKKVGLVFRTQTNTNPVFVSPGHLISLEGCLQVVQLLKGDYRIPDLARWADQMARARARNESGHYQDLGFIPSYPPPFED
ncbi:MAG: endonuclease V [Bacteroidota bacterium]